MAKVRVQDATKELSANTGKMLESVSQMRKKTQELLGSLRKISADFNREAQEAAQRAALEEQKKRYEADAQFMNAYSSEQVPEVPKEAPAPAPAEPVEAAKPVAEEVKPVREEKKPEQPKIGRAHV